MKTVKRFILYGSLIFAMTLFAIPARAQGLGQVYHPGDVVKVTVTFAGPDADKIVGAAFRMTIPSPPSSQVGFMADIYTADAKPIGPPHTFEISYTIPETQASGEYPLNEIRAVVQIASASAQFVIYFYAPAEFQSKTFKVENSRTFVKPTVKDVH